MAEITGYSVCGAMLPKFPDVDRASRALIVLREPFVRYAHPDAGWIIVQMIPDKIHITERRRHEHVGVTSPGHEKASDLLAIPRIMPLLLYAQHVLGRRRFVIHIQRVNVGPIFQKEPCDFDIGGEVQRRLSISAFCMHNIRVRRHQFLQFRHYSEPGSSVGIYYGAAFDKETHQARVAIIQHTEAARPPIGSFLDVGACMQQDIDRRSIASLYGSEQCMLSKSIVRQWLVDLCP